MSSDVCMCHIWTERTVGSLSPSMPRLLFKWMLNGTVLMLTVPLCSQFHCCYSRLYRPLCVLCLPLFSLTTLISPFSVMHVIPCCPPSFLFLFCTFHRKREQEYLSSSLPFTIISRRTVDNRVGQCHQCFDHTEDAGREKLESQWPKITLAQCYCLCYCDEPVQVVSIEGLDSRQSLYSCLSMTEHAVMWVSEHRGRASTSNCWIFNFF